MHTFLNSFWATKYLHCLPFIPRMTQQFSVPTLHKDWSHSQTIKYLGAIFFSPSYVEPVSAIYSFTLFAFLNSETGREQKSPKYSNHAKTHVTIQYLITWHVVLQLKKQFWQCRVQSRACGLFLHFKALDKKKKKKNYKGRNSWITSVQTANFVRMLHTEEDFALWSTVWNITAPSDPSKKSTRCWTKMLKWPVSLMRQRIFPVLQHHHANTRKTLKTS